MIDFHCHLELYKDPVAEAERCALEGIEILSVGTTPSAFRGTLRIGKKHQNIRTALGFHPHLAAQRMGELALFDEFLPEARFVGEVGLDGAPEHRKSWNQQVKVFSHILRQCASVGGRLISVHSRRAAPDVLDLLERHRSSGTPVLHWFSGTQKELSRAIGIGAWFSVGPAMLRSNRGRDLAAAMPQDRLLTETDGPFAMIQNRPLAPGEVQTACSVLGEIWGCDLEAAKTLLKSNLHDLEKKVV